MDKEKELHDKYMEWMLPALKNLEKEIQEKVNAFEDEYHCSIWFNHPTGEQFRFERKSFNLSQCHVGGDTYNLMVRLLGLNQEDYPLLQHF